MVINRISFTSHRCPSVCIEYDTYETNTHRNHISFSRHHNHLLSNILLTFTFSTVWRVSINLCTHTDTGSSTFSFKKNCASPGSAQPRIFQPFQYSEIDIVEQSQCPAVQCKCNSYQSFEQFELCIDVIYSHTHTHCFYRPHFNAIIHTITHIAHHFPHSVGI